MTLQSPNSSFLARHRWLVWTMGIAIAVVLLASFMSREEPVPVRAALATRGTIRSVVSTNGKVEPLQNFEAHAPVGTTVKRVFVKEGDHVRKGQLLVALEDSDARSQAARALAQVRASEVDVNGLHTGGTQEEVLTAESDLAKARTAQDAAQRNLDALRRLQQQGSASSGEVVVAQSQLARAQADVKLLEQKLKDRYSQPEIARVQAQQAEAQSAYSAAEDVLGKLNIRAPFDGIVYSLPVRQGNYLNAGDLVLQEADLSKVQIRAFVDEPDVGRLSPGQKIEVTWDGLPGRVWGGKLTAVPASVKLRGARNIGESTCTVDNADLKLLPNTNVGVTIVTAEHFDVLTVPREAIRQDDSQPYVFQIVDDRLQRRDIQMSIANLTKAEVTSGLSQNARVALVSTNSKPLHDGLAVRVVQ
ncbi:MAG TPA: efflux RND transporter periplasmic adaptor subunit [Terriglobales bacterium]|nr:efflux RND transporter periplasmic adaptor subunit [Terriglobales bacterium]